MGRQRDDWEIIHRLRSESKCAGAHDVSTHQQARLLVMCESVKSEDHLEALERGGGTI